MIKINLLPFRAARKKENVRRQVTIFMLFLGVVVIALVGYNMLLGSQVNSFQEKIAEVTKELTIYESQAKEVDRIKKKLAALNQKIKIIKQLETDRKAPTKLLESMDRSFIAKRMWLTQLKATAKNQLSLQGIALDNQTVADFMTRLEETKQYKSVNLARLSKANIKNMDLKQFDIKCENPLKKKTSPKKKRRKPRR